MKMTISIVICTLVVLLQQMQVPMAQLQICSTPTCPSGTSLNTKTCQCGESRDSTCLSGFTRIIKPNGLCACEKKTKPTCPRGFTLNSACTLCTIHSTPSCPSGSTLSPSLALCTRTVKPICPPGYVHRGCECVKGSERQCSSGMLSSNDCKCTSGLTSTPTCQGNRCILNTSGCTCSSLYIGVQCYNGRFCNGLAELAFSVQDCCGFSFGSTKSYRIGGQGACTPCFSPH